MCGEKPKRGYPVGDCMMSQNQVRAFSLKAQRAKEELELRETSFHLYHFISFVWESEEQLIPKQKESSI